jgi:hypothetical protein
VLALPSHAEARTFERPNGAQVGDSGDAHRVRACSIARRLCLAVKDLPLISPHGHVDPRILAEDIPFPDPAALLVILDHYLVRMLYSQGVSLESLGVPRLDLRPPALSPSAAVCRAMHSVKTKTGHRPVPMSGVRFNNYQSGRLQHSSENARCHVSRRYYRSMWLHVSMWRRIALGVRLRLCNRGFAITRRDELDQVIDELIGHWGTQTSCGIPAGSGIETLHPKS